MPVPRPRYANPRGLAEETCRRLRWFWPPDPTAGFEQLAHRRRVARRGSASARLPGAWRRAASRGTPATAGWVGGGDDPRRCQHDGEPAPGDGPVAPLRAGLVGSHPHDRAEPPAHPVGAGPAERRQVGCDLAGRRGHVAVLPARARSPSGPLVERRRRQAQALPVSERAADRSADGGITAEPGATRPRSVTWAYLWHPQRDSNPHRHLERAQASPHGGAWSPCRAPGRWDHPSVSGMGPLRRGVNVGVGMIVGVRRAGQARRRW